MKTIMAIKRFVYKLPVSSDRLGWHKFYARRFNICVAKGEDPRPAQQLSLWYLFIHLAEGGTYVD